MKTPFIIFLPYAISYLLFSALLWKSKKAGGLRLVDTIGPVSNPVMLLILHGAGIVLFGMVPFIARQASPPAVFQHFETAETSTLVSLIIAIGLLLFSLHMAKKNFGEKPADSFSQTIPGIPYLSVYFLFRLVFISVYEIWFRGYLLNDCIAAVGIMGAICINVLFYTLIHFVNGKKEIIACIPFGTLLCGLCIWQGDVWPAIVLHLSFTLPYEFSLLRKFLRNQPVQKAIVG